MSTTMSSPVDLALTAAEKSGITVTGLAALTSLTAIVALIIFKRPRRNTFRNTHTYGYAMSLLLANVLQAVGTVIDFQWVEQEKVSSGPLCNFQGGIKQVGNMGISFWSLIIAVHLFQILFVRIRVPRGVFIGVMVAPWIIAVGSTLVGPFVLQNNARGSYFGIEGVSCGISAGYLNERMVLDYVFSIVSVSLSLVLFILVLLRVRGTLVRDKYHHWTFNAGGKKLNGWNIPVVEDTYLNSLVRKLVWYPVIFSAILIPITVVRIAEFNGTPIPFFAISAAGFVFNMMGFINVILLLCLGNCTNPQPTLPTFTVLTPRGELRPSIDKSGNSFMELTIPDNAMMTEKISEKSFYSHSRQDSRKVLVKMPAKPPNTFVAPDSWKTTAPRPSPF